MKFETGKLSFKSIVLLLILFVGGGLLINQTISTTEQNSIERQRSRDAANESYEIGQRVKNSVYYEEIDESNTFQESKTQEEKNQELCEMMTEKMMASSVGQYMDKDAYYNDCILGQEMIQESVDIQNQ